jgi:hypothetical protein
MAGFYKVKHRLDFSFVFSTHLPLEETRFQQAGSFSVEGTSQVVLGHTRAPLLRPFSYAKSSFHKCFFDMKWSFMPQSQIGLTNLCSILTMLDVAMDLLHVKFIHATKVRDATNPQH